MGDQPTFDLAAVLRTDSTNLIAQDSSGPSEPPQAPVDDPGAATGIAVGSPGWNGNTDPGLLRLNWAPRTSATGWSDASAVQLDDIVGSLATYQDVPNSTPRNGLNNAQYLALDDIAAEGQTDFVSNCLVFMNTADDGSVRGFSQVPVFNGYTIDGVTYPASLMQSVQVGDRYQNADTSLGSVDMAMGTASIPDGIPEESDRLVPDHKNPILIGTAPGTLNGARQLSLVAEQVLAPDGDYGYEYFVPASPAATAATAAPDPTLVADLQSLDQSQGISIDYPTLSRTPMALMMAQTTLASISQAFSQASYEFLYQAGQFAAQVGADLPSQLFDFVAAVESSLRQLGENASETGAVIVTCCQRFVAIEYGTSSVSSTYSSAFSMGSVTDPVAAMTGESSAPSFSYSHGTASLTTMGRTRLQDWSNAAWTTQNSNQSEANFFRAYAGALLAIATAIRDVHLNLSEFAQKPIGGLTRPLSFIGMGTVAAPNPNLPGPATVPVASVSGSLYPAQGCWTGLMANAVLQMIDQECDSLMQLADNVSQLADQLNTIGNQLIPDPLAWFKSALLYLIDAALVLISLAVTFGPAIGAAVGVLTAGTVETAGEAVTEVATIVVSEAELTGSAAEEAVASSLTEATTSLTNASQLDISSGSLSGYTEGAATGMARASQILANELTTPGYASQLGVGLLRGMTSGVFNAGSSLAAYALEEGIEAAIWGRSYDASDMAESWWKWALALFGGSTLAGVTQAAIRGVTAIARLIDRPFADLIPVAFSADARSAITSALRAGKSVGEIPKPPSVSSAQWWFATSKPLDVGVSGLSSGLNILYGAAITEVLYVVAPDPNIKPNWAGLPISTLYWFSVGAMANGALKLGPKTAQEFPSLATLAQRNGTISGFLLNMFGTGKPLTQLFPVQNGVGQTLKFWLTSFLYTNVLYTASKWDWLPVVTKGPTSSHPGSNVTAVPDYQAIADLIKALPDDAGAAPSAETQALFNQLALHDADFLSMIAGQHLAAAAQGVADPMAACIATLQTDVNNGDAFTAMWEQALKDPFGDFASVGEDALTSYEAKAEMMNDIALWASPDGVNTGLYHGEAIDSVIASVNTDDVWNEWVAAMRTYAGSDPNLNRAYKWALVCYDNGVDISKAPPTQVLQIVRDVDNVLIHNGWMVALVPQHVVTNSSTLMPITNPTLVDSIIAAS